MIWVNATYLEQLRKIEKVADVALQINGRALAYLYRIQSLKKNCKAVNFQRENLEK